MPILGKLIKPVYIYAGKLKTPKTGRKHANKGIYSRTIAESMLICFLPIMRSYTAGNSAPIISADGRPPKHWTTYGNGRPKTDTNGRPPKVYIHSGIIGNAIPGSAKSAETVGS